MKRTNIDPTTLELTDTLVELRRVSKTVKAAVTPTSPPWWW